MHFHAGMFFYLHGGELMGYFDIVKTLDVLLEHFYWSK
jgi:hypothetical protein